MLYKLGDAFAGSLMTPFLLKSMAFSPAEVGVVNKIIGLWLTIGGALLGGLLMLRLGLWRALLLFGILQMASNLGFWWLAVSGKGLMPGLVLPAFDWGFVQLAQPTPVDGGLLMVIAFENLSGGMGTAAFVAFLMSLCNQRFTATQYALLSAFASVGPGLGRAAGRRAGRIDRLAGVLHRQHRGRAAGAVDAVVAARQRARARGRPGHGRRQRRLGSGARGTGMLHASRNGHEPNFVTHAELPALARTAPAAAARCMAGAGCRWACWAWARPRAAAGPGANEGVDVGKSSQLRQAGAGRAGGAGRGAAVRADAAARRAQKRALAPDDHPQLVRLRYIAKRIIPFTPPWNPRAKQWKWEVILLGSPQVNAFCMPGGKIAFFWGILSQLQLSDDEVAMIMGHEMAHALREHARERMGKSFATRGALELGCGAARPGQYRAGWPPAWASRC